MIQKQKAKQVFRWLANANLLSPCRGSRLLTADRGKARGEQIGLADAAIETRLCFLNNPTP
jgi:hypothetical protein